MTRVCKRGHLVAGSNAKRRPSTKYVQCRKCENESTARRRKLVKEKQ